MTYGVSVSKGCNSPTYVGQPYECFFIFGNNNPTTTSNDTVKLTSVVDQVTYPSPPSPPFPGAPIVVNTSGNILSSLSLIASPAPGTKGAPTCFSAPSQPAPGAGTVASPWTNVAFCILPYGASVNSTDFGHYAPTAADYNASPSHKLNDQATYTWNNLCDQPTDTTSCDTTNNQNQAPSSTLVSLYTPTITTQLSAASGVIGAGGSVTDQAAVTFDSQPLATPPTINGTITYQLFSNNTCTTLATTPSLNQQVAWTGGPIPASAPVTFPAGGQFWFQATFSGDAADGINGPVSSPCTSEPLTVVDAKISIAPNGTNPVGTPHTFTVHVDQNPGTGFVPAPNRVVTVSIAPGGVGVITPPAQCTTDANGNCTVVDTSTKAGTDSVSASTTFTLNGVTLTRATDSTHGSSGPATKNWVTAQISITPSKTNEVGVPHTFTVTVQQNTGGGLSPVVGVPVTVTLTKANGATLPNAATGTCVSGTTNAQGQCLITFVSPTPGTVTGSATATFNVNGVSTTVTTDGTGSNSGPAVKTYVDANIQITPGTATNHVGSPHTLTGHVNVNTGDGNGYVNAPAGTTINFSKVSGPGLFGGNTTASCATVGTTGSCTVVLTSSTAGQTVIHGSTNITVGGVPLVRATSDGKTGDGNDVTKNWINATITIAPTQTNPVGTAHTFTVTVKQDTGSGLVPAPGVHVNFTLTDANGAVDTVNNNGTTCGQGGANTANTDANGQCLIVFNSQTTGTVTGHASTTLTFNGQSFTIATDGIGGDSVDAVKTYVDANIQLTPQNATNQVGSPHTLTAHVNIDAGDGKGFVNAPAGTSVTLSVASGPGSFGGNSSTTCTTVGTTGSCTAVLTSSKTGVTKVHATATVTVGGIQLTRATGDANANDSADATKTWVNAAITITPNATNEVGVPHTFTVTVTKDTGTGTFVPAANEHVDVTLTPTNGATLPAAATGTCTQAGANTNASGQCTIVFVSPTPGKVTGHATSTLSIGTPATSVTVSTNGTSPNSGDAVKTYVDANIQITPATATNPLNATHTLTGHVNVNTGTGGYVNAPIGTVINFTKISGPGSFVNNIASCTTSDASGSCTVAITSSVVGTTVVRASTSVTVGTVVLSRATNDGKAGDSVDAQKNWVTASITITPSQTNEVGVPHTFTVTLLVNNGQGLVPAPNQHVDVTLTPAKGASITPSPTGSCTKSGANTDSNGQCTIVFVSPTAGTVTGHASSTLLVGGVSTTVDTTGADAVKTYVDANIQITPGTAANHIGTNHTLTGHVNVLPGDGTTQNAPAGTTITFSKVSGPGSFVNGTNTCQTVGATGSCTVAITSSTTGTTVVRATTTVTVGGLQLTRTTNDGKNGDSADAQKVWVNAVVTITPSATNAVGQPHTFTVTLQQDNGSGTLVPFANQSLTVTLTPSNGATPSPAGPFTCTTNASGQCFVTFTSATTGQVNAHVSGTVTIGGISVSVASDGLGGDSGDATKTFVNSRIQITPATAFNQIGTDHTLTGHVDIDTGNGSGFAPAPAGTVINFSITNGPGSFDGPSQCTTVGATGSCTVQIKSTTTGVTTIHATTAVTVGGVMMSRATGDSNVGDSADAMKTWVNATIAITPNATNEVGVPHTFTVTLLQDTGTGTLVPAQGQQVTVTLTDSNGANHGAVSGTCTGSGTTNAAGQCTVITSSPSAGQVAATAKSTLTVNGVSITVQTNGQAGNSGSAVKTYVDANIQITPATAANAVGTNHTLTGHVNVNLGDGKGFVNAPIGTVINFTKQSGPGSFVGGISQCTVADATGSCTVAITSTTTGTTVVRATTNVTVGGVVLTRTTNDGKAGDSVDAQKTWVNASITISPSAINEVGQPHTFTVTLLKDTGTGTLGPAAGEHVDVTLTDINGAVHTAPTGSCTNNGTNTDKNGQCTIVFTSNSAGKVIGHATATITVNGVTITVATTGASGNAPDAVKTFVDANIQLTPSTASNPVGTNHTLTAHVNVNPGTGFVNAPDGTVVTVNITSGPGTPATQTCTTAGGTGSCTVTITSQTTGTTTINASTAVVVGGLTLHRSTGDGLNGDSSNATKVWRNVTVVTNVLDVNGNDVTGTQIPSGSVVHDKVTVTGLPPGSPTPSGNVVFTLYQSATCDPASGTVGSPQTVALTNGTAVTTATAPLTSGSYGFQAEFKGDQANNFPDVTGPCEPFTVNTIVVGPCVLGYPDNSNPPRSSVDFNESSVLVSAGLFGSGSNQHVGVFYSDEHALTLGVEPGVTPYPGSVPPNGQPNPSVGDKTVTDGFGRPIFPAMFVTDITSNPNSRSGDWQQGADNTGAKTPTLLFGTWKDATVGSTKQGSTITPGADPTANPNWQLGNGADTPPSATSPQQYTSEVVWNTQALGLVPGHAYRLQVMVHDGDQNHTGGDVGEACINVVIPLSPPPPDANISITPSTATNPVGTNHTLTAQVQVNSGSGLVNAPAGTNVTFSIVSGPGSFSGPNTCTTVGTTGACTAVITSSSAGTTVVKAATDVTVLSKSLHRETGDTNAGDSGNASKTWVACGKQTPCPPNATIQITPATATNPVGTTHTLTATVNVDQGQGAGLQLAPAGTKITFSIVSGPGSFVGPNTCNTAGPTGACTAVITSTSTGTTVVRAATDVTIGGPGGTTLHRETNDTNAGDSADAQKTWVPCVVPGGGSPTLTATQTTFGPANTPAWKITYNQPLSLNDNSYSSTSPTVFWNGKQHKFSDLTGSDKAEFVIANNGTTLFDFAIDYISAKSGTPSGYGSLGPFGGDGAFTTGTKSAILGWTTTEDDNLNTTGYCTNGNCTSNGVNLLTDSPPPVSSSDETQGAAAPFSKWNYVDGYTVYIAASALPSNFSASMVSVPLAHNSPSKSQTQSSCPPNANIQISPATATNPTGTTHTLTGHVNVDANGTGNFANAPDGTKITFSIVSGPGNFVGPSTCSTSGGTGSCTAVITSSSPGTTVVRAATDVAVAGPPGPPPPPPGGTTLHRETNDANAGDSADAQKTWTGAGPCVLGYPDASNAPRSQAVFNESSVLVSAQLFGSGSSQYIGVFTDDEHALTLGVDPGVSPYPGSPPNGGLANPLVGNMTATDGSGRPLFPSAFVTDITSNPNSRSGDWQQQSTNANAKSPSKIFGSWKSATQSGSSITPGPDPAANNWNLGTGADTPPSTKSQGYNSEVEWSAQSLGLQSGHTYRIEVMVHDGDQNHSGGDVGEACVNVTLP